MNKIKHFLKNFNRKIFFLNKLENEYLTEEFKAKVLELKENNSQIVWTHYYLPKAQALIFKEENYLPSEKSAEPRATAMMLNDLAQGILDEFYKFKEEEN